VSPDILKTRSAVIAKWKLENNPAMTVARRKNADHNFFNFVEARSFASITRIYGQAYSELLM